MKKSISFITGVLMFVLAGISTANATSIILPGSKCSECSDEVLARAMPKDFTAIDGKQYAGCNELCNAYRLAIGTPIVGVIPGDPNEHGVYVYYEYSYTETCGKVGVMVGGIETAILGSCGLDQEAHYICGKGYYGTATSETSGCTKCPANATCTRGTDFDCNSGWYKNTAGNGCSKCPNPTTGPGDQGNWTVSSSKAVGSGAIIIGGATGAENIGQCYLENNSVVTDTTGTYVIEGATGSGIAGMGGWCDYYGRY